ncbi:hypothetical protein PR048_021093 [Dryococelus australis]|uniref:Uncharacterized protein n=1 Tax=Dryococelus australis TaxID=614101 RepID=A0ABQ9GX98_9NEOP|nr:hypothetical protein PR048_021093 [Dryococelus australis]
MPVAASSRDTSGYPKCWNTGMNHWHLELICIIIDGDNYRGIARERRRSEEEDVVPLVSLGRAVADVLSSVFELAGPAVLPSFSATFTVLFLVIELAIHAVPPSISRVFTVLSLMVEPAIPNVLLSFPGTFTVLSLLIEPVIPSVLLSFPINVTVQSLVIEPAIPAVPPSFSGVFAILSLMVEPFIPNTLKFHAPTMTVGSPVLLKVSFLRANNSSASEYPYSSGVATRKNEGENENCRLCSRKVKYFHYTSFNLHIYHDPEIIWSKTHDLVKKLFRISKVESKRATNILKVATNKALFVFFQNDDYSRLMPGKKDCKSVQGSTVAIENIQKRLIFCDLKELPKCCVLASSASTHSICICLYYHSVKLLFSAIKSQHSYNELLKHMVGNIENEILW